MSTKTPVTNNATNAKPKLTKATQVFLSVFWALGHAMESIERFHMGKVRPFVSFVAYLLVFQLAPLWLSTAYFSDGRSPLLFLLVNLSRPFLITYGALCVYRSVKRYVAIRWKQVLWTVFLTAQIAIAWFTLFFYFHHTLFP